MSCLPLLGQYEPAPRWDCHQPEHVSKHSPSSGGSEVPTLVYVRMSAEAGAELRISHWPKQDSPFPRQFPFLALLPGCRRISTVGSLPSATAPPTAGPGPPHLVFHPTHASSVPKGG